MSTPAIVHVRCSHSREHCLPEELPCAAPGCPQGSRRESVLGRAPVRDGRRPLYVRIQLPSGEWTWNEQGYLRF